MDKQESFEANLSRLEQVVRLLESGESSLDASFQLFQEGIALVRQCNSQLDGIEAKVQTLIESSTSQPVNLFGTEE